MESTNERVTRARPSTPAGPPRHLGADGGEVIVDLMRAHRAELAGLRNEFADVLRALKAELEAVHALLRGRSKSHFTVEEVAELTARSEYTVRRWIANGLIKAERLKSGGPKGRLLIAREELEKLVTAAKGTAIPGAAVG